jgi:hypothetical protein
MIPVGILTAAATSSFSFLLDNYPGAAVAYSFRKLRAGYTGNCIQVRRSSDNSTQDIGFLNNVLDTTALLTFVGAGNGFVSIWYDQSGNGRNAIQLSTTLQPFIVVLGIITLQNSKPSILFDGINDFLRYSVGVNFITSNTLSSWAVANKINSTNPSGRVYGINGGGPDFNSLDGAVLTVIDSSNLALLVRNNTTLGTQPYTYNTFVLFNTIFTGTTGNFYKNNSAASSAAQTGNFNSGAFNIGYGVGSPGDFHAGYISEIILYSTNQISNRSGINTNINSFYTIY